MNDTPLTYDWGIEMVVLYAESDDVAERLGGLLRGDHDADPICLPLPPTRAADTALERGSLPKADCLVFAVPAADLHGVAGGIRRIGARVPMAPCILVTDPEHRVARLCRNLSFFDIIWFHEAPLRLARTIALATSGGAFGEWAKRAEASGHPALLRQALALAFRRARTRPFLSPRALAAAVGCSPTTLSHQFHAAAGGACTLQDLLSSLVVLSARNWRTAGNSWTQTAKACEMTRRTLRNKARRWPGCTPTELVHVSLPDLLERFERECVGEVLPPQ